MAGPMVSGWDDPRWLREAERILAEVVAAEEQHGRRIAKRPHPMMLRKLARHLDVARYGGGATDEQKSQLLRAAVRKALDRFDLEELRLTRVHLVERVDAELDRLPIPKEVRSRARTVVERKIDRALEVTDRLGMADAGAVELDVESLVRPAVEHAAFVVAVSAEVAHRLDAQLFDDATAKILREWARRVGPQPDPSAFVDDCLTLEAVRSASPNTMRSDASRAFLNEAWAVLAEEYAPKLERQGRYDVVATASAAIETKATWMDRTGESPPDDVRAYVGRVVWNARYSTPPGPAQTEESPSSSGIDGSDRPTPVYGAAPELPELDVEMEELGAILQTLELYLRDAGRALADALEARRHGLHSRQRAMFASVFDVTTVTIQLLISDVREARSSCSGGVAAVELEDAPVVSLLQGLTAGGKVGTRWLKPWTFRAMTLVDATWAATYAGLPYEGTRTLPEADWKRLHRITAGADPNDYVDQTARGGSVALLQNVLAPAITRLQEMRDRYRRGEKDGAR